VRWSVVCGALLVGACGFELQAPSLATDARHDSADASNVDPPWWDAAWGHRRQLVVTTGALRPDKGYEHYTVRLVVDAAQLTGAACDDVRIVTWDGIVWTELAHHVLCGNSELDVRFALPVDLDDSTAWRGAFLYYDHPGAPNGISPEGSSVYLWWDPATADHAGDYARGRMDPWLSTGHDNSLAWNTAEFYTYNTGDDSQSSYRRPVDERDVLIEASWFHTGCYPFNMHSGVCARGIIATGTAGSETSTHYYCSSRAQNPNCANNDQGIYDGDVVAGDNETIALQGLTDPPPIVAQQWRSQALAVFGVGPTQLRFWDADTAWPTLAVPPATALQASGAAVHEHAGRGFAGIMTAQDIAHVRNIVIRRYTEPEPVVSIEEEVARP